MYKVFYKDNCIDEDIIENIDYLFIDVSDINNMKYIDVTHQEDINLLILYVRCLKHYHTKLKLTDRFPINNNFKDNRKIVQSILNCNWIINEDDITENNDKLEEIKQEFMDEIADLSGSGALKDIHRIHLMQYFIHTLKQAKKRAEITDEKTKELIKK